MYKKTTTPAIMMPLFLSLFVLTLTQSASTLALLSSPASSSSSFGFSSPQQSQQQFFHQSQQELVPSANIFTPAWLAQRRSRHLSTTASTGTLSAHSANSPSIYALYQPPPQMYQQPQQPQQQVYRHYQHQMPQTTSSHYLGSTGRRPLPMFHLVPSSQPQPHYYQPNFETMTPHSPHTRFSPAYYHSPPTGTFYLAPVVHVPTTTTTTATEGDHHHISKRVDHHFLKPLSSGNVNPKPCSASSAPLPSEQYPVYVLPPKNFQPIIYHQQAPSYHPHGSPVVTKTAEELWYESSDMTGKVKFGNGGKHSTTDGNALQTDRQPLHSNEFRKIYLVPVTSEQVGGGQSGSFPIYEAVIREVATAAADANADRKPMTNAFNAQIERRPHPSQQQQLSTSEVQADSASQKINTQDQRRPLKTKLPVGLTSFFLGGVRGVSGRHWGMPPALVKDLEFMPNLSPMSPENKYLPEESYVKKVDNGGGGATDSSVASAGDPEKEDLPMVAVSSNNKSRNQATGDIKNKKIFEGTNTIIDTPLDLETAESSSSSSKQVINIVAPAHLPPSIPAAFPSVSIAKS